MINFKEMDYWQLRAIIARVVPGMTQFRTNHKKVERVQEKGRKKNYSEFKLDKGEWVKQERLLNNTEINSFLEISVRAAACPMPFNMDVWDSLNCIVKGQQVTTKRGEILIEEVIVGDIVLSFNEKTKELEWKEVLFTKSALKSNIIEIESDLGLLRLTEDHQLFTQRGWIEARYLALTDTLYTNDGDLYWHILPVKIKSYYWVDEVPVEVYDLTVQDNPNFFAEGILVHNCPFACIYCFPAGTQIMMVDGTEKSIERIHVGDRVMSFNETTKELEPAEVTQPMKRHYNSELICIEIEDEKVLKMTPEHPIYTQRGWVEAKELNTKDEVLIW